MTYEYNNNPITKEFLNCIGFFKDPSLGNVWEWGRFTTNDHLGKRVDVPILTWDEKTSTMFARPILYSKKIDSIEGFRKMMDTVSFLMSTES